MARDPFTRAAFQRRQRLEYDESGNSATFMTPEDIVVAKLVAYRETESDKHLRDALGILRAQEETLDLDAVRRDAHASRVLEQYEKLLEAIERNDT